MLIGNPLTILTSEVFGSLYVNSAANAASQTGQDIWRDVEEASISAGAARQIVPNRYRTIAAHLTALDSLLTSAPRENTAVNNAEVVLSLPLPDGTLGRFRIQEYAMMEPELAAKFPEIKTYLGQGIDDPTATVHLDRTPAGFHGMILSSGGTIYGVRVASGSQLRIYRTAVTCSFSIPIPKSKRMHCRLWLTIWHSIKM